MLARKIRIQITLFIAIALLAVSYIAIHYVGILHDVGATGYTVRTELPYSGGLFENAEVTYRGVPVGRIGGMRLNGNGIEVDANISSSSTHIPSDVTANVANRSVIGEEYLNLVPNSDDGPYLHDGSVIAQADTTVPVSANQLLEATNTLLTSIPITSLQTTVRELSDAFQNSSPDIQRLIDSTNTFYLGAQANFDDTSALLASSKTVLATQEASSQSIITFAHNLALINASLQANDAGLRSLITVAPGAAAEVNGVFTDISSTFTSLITNLTANAEVFQANVDGLQTLLVKAPEAISLGNKVVTPTGANLGLALTFFNPLPCTAGYGGTVRRPPTDVNDNVAVNASAGCRSTSAASEVNGAKLPAITSSTAGQLARSAVSGTTATTLASLLGGQG